MAIAQVGAPTSFNGTSAAQTSIVVNVPTGVADGNLLLLVVASQTATTMTTPTGWTAVTNMVTTTTGQSMNVYYRVASSEPASYTLTTPSARQAAVMAAFSGVDTTTPLDVTPPAPIAGTTGSTFPAITPVTSGAWVIPIDCFSQASTSSVTVAANNWTAVLATAQSQGTTTTVDSSIAAGYFTWTSGAYTPTVGVGTTSRTIAGDLALRPAGAGSAAATATASITLSASGDTSAPAAGSAALTLSASGTGTMPGLTYSDDFNRANGALGTNWVTNSATPVSISSNQVIAGTAASAARWNGGSIATGILVSQMTWPGGNGGGVAVAMPAFTSASSYNIPSYYVFRELSGGTYIALKDAGAGTHTILTTIGSDWTAGDVVRLEYDGTTLTAYRNGVIVGTATPSSPIDPTVQNGVGIVGSIGNAASAVADNWAGGSYPVPAASASGTASISLTASGVGTTPIAGTASLDVTASGGAGTSSTGSASITLDASGVVGSSIAGSASLSITGSGTSQAVTTGTGSLTLSASGTTSQPGAGSASIALSASGTTRATASGAAALTVTASGATTSPVTGAAALAVSGTGFTSQPGAGTASIALSATGATRGVATGAGAITLTGTGATKAVGTGSASLAVSASGFTSQPAAGSASIGVSATGTATSKITGSASLSVTGTGSTSATALGSAALTVSATGSDTGVAAGSATLTVTGSGTTPPVAVTGAAALTLTASGATSATARSTTGSITVVARNVQGPGTWNNAANPSFETSGATNFSASNGTRAQSSVWSEQGTFSSKVTVVAANVTSYVYMQSDRGQVGRTPIEVGQYASVRVRVRAIKDIVVRMNIAWYRNGTTSGATTSSGSDVTILAGQEATIERLNVVAPAQGTYDGWLPLMYYNDAGKVPTGATISGAGEDYFYVDGWVLISSHAAADVTSPIPYFDGGTQGYTWLSTAGTSASAAIGQVSAAALGAGSITLSASGASTVPETGGASISFSATGQVSAPITGAASIALSGSGAARAPETATASISLSASGTAGARTTGSASIAVTGSTTARGTGTASASISLVAGGVATPRATGTASVSLSASGGVGARVGGSASFQVVGTAQLAAAANAQALITLSATGTAHRIPRDINIRGSVDPSRFTVTISQPAFGVSVDPTPMSAELEGSGHSARVEQRWKATL